MRTIVGKNARRKRARRIHAVGSYGMRNFGDDLFVDTILARGHEIWPGSKVRTFVPSNAAFYSRTGPAGKFLRLGVAIAGLLWSDTVAMCGGSIMQDIRGVARWRMKFLPSKRVEALGVSVGPTFDGDAAERVGHLIGTLERFVVRDKASVERVKELGLDIPLPSVGGDLVALNPFVVPAESKSNYVIICPSAASGIGVQVLAGQVIAGLDQVAEHAGSRPYVKVLALASTPHANDEPICTVLSDLIRQRGYTVENISYSTIGLKGTIQEIAGSYMVWTQRLHGGIVAYLTEVPFLLVGHHAKCVDFSKDIGLDKRALVGVDSDWKAGVDSLLSSAPLWKLDPLEYRQQAEFAYIL